MDETIGVKSEFVQLFCWDNSDDASTSNMDVTIREEDADCNEMDTIVISETDDDDIIEIDEDYIIEINNEQNEVDNANLIETDTCHRYENDDDDLMILSDIGNYCTDDGDDDSDDVAREFVGDYNPTKIEANTYIYTPCSVNNEGNIINEIPSKIEESFHEDSNSAEVNRRAPIVTDNYIDNKSSDCIETMSSTYRNEIYVTKTATNSNLVTDDYIKTKSENYNYESNILQFNNKAHLASSGRETNEARFKILVDPKKELPDEFDRETNQFNFDAFVKPKQELTDGFDREYNEVKCETMIEPKQEIPDEFVNETNEINFEAPVDPKQVLRAELVVDEGGDSELQESVHIAEFLNEKKGIQTIHEDHNYAIDFDRFKERTYCVQSDRNNVKRNLKNLYCSETFADYQYIEKNAIDNDNYVDKFSDESKMPLLEKELSKPVGSVQMPQLEKELENEKVIYLQSNKKRNKKIPLRYTKIISEVHKQSRKPITKSRKVGPMDLTIPHTQTRSLLDIKKKKNENEKSMLHMLKDTNKQMSNNCMVAKNGARKHTPGVFLKQNQLTPECNLDGCVEYVAGNERVHQQFVYVDMRKIRGNPKIAQVASNLNINIYKFDSWCGCSLCNKAFPFAPCCESHIIKNHLQEGYSCVVPGCGFKVDSMKQLSLHWKEKHNLHDCKCPFCRRFVPTRGNLFKHVEICQTKYMERRHLGSTSSKALEQILVDYKNSFFKYTCAWCSSVHVCRGQYVRRYRPPAQCTISKRHCLALEEMLDKPMKDMYIQSGITQLFRSSNANHSTNGKSDVSIIKPEPSTYTKTICTPCMKCEVKKAAAITYEFDFNKIQSTESTSETSKTIKKVTVNKNEVSPHLCRIPCFDKTTKKRIDELKLKTIYYPIDKKNPFTFTCLHMKLQLVNIRPKKCCI